MKCKYTKFLPLALSAALLFTGCATQPVVSTASNDAVSPTAISQSVDSLDALTTADSADTATETAASGEAFSKRDLSGAYDESEAVTILLNGGTLIVNGQQVDSIPTQMMGGNGGFGKGGRHG